jgi:NAD(P)-dependent dehydrogenase (short-subunit alcohol dehydrogenase family)/dienelactone hydrolase
VSATAPVVQQVTFPSLDRDAAGRNIALRGFLILPPSARPAGGYPAVIAMHGCGGVYSLRKGHEDELAERMRIRARLYLDEGFAVLFPDSFRPRSTREVCTVRVGEPTVTSARRRLDALGALEYLAHRGDIAVNRIALVGWSHGGSATLYAINVKDPEVAVLPRGGRVLSGLPRAAQGEGSLGPRRAHAHPHRRARRLDPGSTLHRSRQGHGGARRRLRRHGLSRQPPRLRRADRQGRASRRRAERRSSRPGRDRRAESRLAQGRQHPRARIPARPTRVVTVSQDRTPMDLALNGKAVLVTGASKGIGLACAQAFAREGARVALVSRSPANLQSAVTQFDARSRPVVIAADLVRADEAKRAVDEAEAALGPLDVLVNSAGAARRYPPEELDASAWHAAMDAKFFSYIHPLDIVVRRMGERGGGAVVNIIGQGGKVASPVHLPGGAANAALMLATTGLAAAFGPRGVRVNAINPGGTLTTRMQEGLAAEARMTGKTPDDLLAAQQARIPLRRLATPEEIAEVALFLASDRARYVTGVIVPMDGGASAVI